VIVVQTSELRGYVEFELPDGSGHPADLLPASAGMPVYVGSGVWRMERQHVGEIVAGLLERFGHVRLERAA
jgi:hypothetical protein